MTMPTIEDTRTIAEVQRARTVAHLRALADYLEERPDIPTPNHTGFTESMTSRSYETSGAVFFPKDPIAAAEIVKSGSGEWSKSISSDDQYMVFRGGVIAGRKSMVYVNREQVCTPKVVGKKTVQKAKPAEYEEVEVDDVTYECGSLMNAASKAALAKLEKQVEA